jgi:hypothetical protein
MTTGSPSFGTQQASRHNINNYPIIGIQHPSQHRNFSKTPIPSGNSFVSCESSIAGTMIGGITFKGFDGAHRAPSEFSIASESLDHTGPAYSMSIYSQSADISCHTLQSNNGKTPGSQLQQEETLRPTVYKTQALERTAYHGEIFSPAIGKCHKSTTHKDETLKPTVYNDITFKHVKPICKPPPVYSPQTLDRQTSPVSDVLPVYQRSANQQATPTKPKHARVPDIPLTRKPKTSITLKMEAYEREEKRIAKAKQELESTKKVAMQPEYVSARSGWLKEKEVPKSYNDLEHTEAAKPREDVLLNTFNDYTWDEVERRRQKQLRNEAGATATFMTNDAVARRGRNERQERY